MLNFKGQHCETTTIGVLMTHIGFDYSEAMLFGLGQGLNYGILPWGTDGFPFLGGRTKQFEITEKLCENLGLRLTANRTTSVKKAWQTLKTYLDEGRPVGLQLDCYHLDYFTSKIHFAGHFAAVTGYDDKDAYLIDTQQQGGMKKTSLESLSLARSEKGPMFGKNLSFVIDRTENEVDLKEAVIKALVSNAESFLNPPITNFGCKGLLRTAKDLKKWYKASNDIEKDFSFAATMMERGGTGGAMFRNLHRDFLKEARLLTGNQIIEEVHELYLESALMWHQVSDVFMKISQTKDESLVGEASQLFKDIEALESKAMKMLLTLK